MSKATTSNLTFKDLAGTMSSYYELTKPGITFTVLASMLIGFLLASTAGVDLVLMMHAILGTYLIAAGTAAHNMFIERDLDSLMKRTSRRPLPAYRIAPKQSFIFSITLIFAGLGYLILMVNVVAGLVSLATTVIYLFAYTPLKRVSALNVFVGAIPGALPVVGGWVAVSGTLFEHGMWILFGIIYCWQIPHVVSISWVCKNDYEHAGFKMLPKNDPNGYKAALWTLLPIVILFPTVYKLFVMDLAGWFYLIGSVITTAVFFYYGLKFSYFRNVANARSLMFSSFIYLPLIWLIIFVDWVIF